MCEQSGAIRQQAITCANIDQYLSCHMASLGHNELRYWLVAWAVPSYYLNKCWIIVNWIPKNINPMKLISINPLRFPCKEICNAFENVNYFPKHADSPCHTWDCAYVEPGYRLNGWTEPLPGHSQGKSIKDPRALSDMFYNMISGKIQRCETDVRVLWFL